MNSFKAAHWAGFFFTLIAGTLLHFVWEWSGYQNWVAVFSAVNESTWEHLKLLFFPFILFSIGEYFWYGRSKNCFFSTKALAVLLGMFLIVSSFYTYTGILGTNFFALDIGVFVLGTAGAYRYSYRRMRRDCAAYPQCCEVLAILLILTLISAFAFFTFHPPKFGIFLAPEPTH